MKYYAVKIGRKPGIYTNWDECKAQVDGFPGAKHKSFKKEQDAQAFLNESQTNNATAEKPNSNNEFDETKPYSFVDGSFNPTTNVYGYGGFLRFNGKEVEIKGNGSDPELAASRNVAGEIMGSVAAVKAAIQHNLKELTIYYDYKGIELWATGKWKRNINATIQYHEIMQTFMKDIHITFVKVKGHSGIPGNERADKLAKKAVGIL